jgi:hypothetical protein
LTSEIEADKCPQCNAPIKWEIGAIQQQCPYCGSTLTKSDATIIKTDDIVLESLSIDQLRNLESKVHATKDYKIKSNAHKLLMETLGSDYEYFIKNKFIIIQSNDPKKYFKLWINGHVEEFEKNEDKTETKLEDGQLYRSGYPAQDAVVTFIHYAKYNVSGLENLWGCGNIVLKGGDINS